MKITTGIIEKLIDLTIAIISLFRKKKVKKVEVETPEPKQDKII